MANILQTTYSAPFSYVITLTGLAQAAFRQSSEVENTVLYNDIVIMLKANGAAGKVGFINNYAFTRVNNQRSENAGAADAAIVPNTPPNLTLVGRMQFSAAGVVSSAAFSIAAAFGGVLPRYHGIVVENRLNGALSAVAGDFLLEGYGVIQQTA